MIGYVKLNLLRLDGIIGIPSGKTRTTPNGEIEAEFLCLSPGTNTTTVWATKKDINTQPLD